MIDRALLFFHFFPPNSLPLLKLYSQRVVPFFRLWTALRHAAFLSQMLRPGPQSPPPPPPPPPPLHPAALVDIRRPRLSKVRF